MKDLHSLRYLDDTKIAMSALPMFAPHTSLNKNKLLLKVYITLDSIGTGV